MGWLHDRMNWDTWLPSSLQTSAVGTETQDSEQRKHLSPSVPRCLPCFWSTMFKSGHHILGRNLIRVCPEEENQESRKWKWYRVRSGWRKQEHRTWGAQYSERGMTAQFTPWTPEGRGTTLGWLLNAGPRTHGWPFDKGRLEVWVKAGKGHLSGGVNSLFLEGFKQNFSVWTGDGGHKR